MFITDFVEIIFLLIIYAILVVKVVLDGFVEFGKQIGVSTDQKVWNIPIPDEALSFAAAVIDQRPVFVINPCSSNRTQNWRNWSVENYSAIAEYVSQQHGNNVTSIRTIFKFNVTRN